MALISRKALTTRPQELGKIKIGGKGPEKTSSGGKKFRMPVKYNHFVVTTRKRGDDENFERDDEIHERIGATPTEIEGYLMYPTVEENFHAELVRYSGQTKISSCNGEEITDIRSGECRACPLAQGAECQAGCKPYSRLHLQLLASKNTLGFHVFRTTSWESTNNIQGALEEIYTRFGTLMGAPVRLVVYPSTDTYEENGKSKTSESHKVGLVLAIPMEELAKKLVAQQRLFVGAQQEIKQLASGVMLELAQRDIEEATDIAQEYFPDASLQTSIATQEKLDGLKKQLKPAAEPEPIQDAVVVETPAASVAESEGAGAAADGGEAPPAAADAPPVDDVAALRARYLDLIKTQAQHLAKAAVRTQWKKRLLARTTEIQDRELGEFDLQCLVTAIEAGDTDPDRSLTAITASMEPVQEPLEDGDLEVMP